MPVSVGFCKGCNCGVFSMDGPYFVGYYLTILGLLFSGWVVLGIGME